MEREKNPDKQTGNLGQDLGSKKVDYWRWEISEGQTKGGDRQRKEKEVCS